MSVKSADDPFRDVVSRLASAEVLLLVTHGRPDGDGLGSMAALADCAGCAGKTVHLLVPDRIPMRYEFLFPHGKPATADSFEDLAQEADLIVIMDTCALAQLDGLAEQIGKHGSKIVVVDHHVTCEDIGAVRWMDTSAAATGVMVGEIIEALGWPVGPVAAEALTVAVTSDTGWLRYANTDARSLLAVAKWVAAGVRTDVLYKKLYQSDRPERLALLARMLGTLELHHRGRLAAMTVRQSDFQATGALPEETENLVNEPLRIASVDTAILLVENADAVRVSLRSRSAIDVAEIAKRFGGGGHRRAAGLRASEDIDVLKKRLVAVCGEELGKSSRTAGGAGNP